MTENIEISPKFLAQKFFWKCLMSFELIAQNSVNCAFPQSLHTKELSKMSAFYAACAVNAFSPFLPKHLLFLWFLWFLRIALQLLVKKKVGFCLRFDKNFLEAGFPHRKCPHQQFSDSFVVISTIESKIF